MTNPFLGPRHHGSSRKGTPVHLLDKCFCAVRLSGWSTLALIGGGCSLLVLTFLLALSIRTSVGWHTAPGARGDRGSGTGDAVELFSSIDATLGAAAGGKAESLPADFDWQAYLKWNPELLHEGITTQRAAAKHYSDIGRGQGLVYRDFKLTLRYTACGGLMNQHYSHISALTLAHLAHADTVIWPPMQERSSFNKRYHPHADKNEQSWVYLDADSLWDLENIKQSVKNTLGIDIVKHPAVVPLPDMTKPDTAFQTYDVDFMQHEAQLRFKKPIYIGRHNPYMLARAIMDAGRQVLIKHSRQPSSVLVDLPCTLFMIDNRNLTLVEDIARLLTFSPYISGLADKVIDGIRAEDHGSDFNGVHLRMEKDAADWAAIIGGREKYWQLYKRTMAKAGLQEVPRPLYVASGLLKAAKEETWSKDEMSRLSTDITDSKLASKVVYKELYLTAADLDGVSNEQSGLIDFLVMRRAHKLIGIGVSTFSFYLYELRLMDGHAPADTELLMLSYIGTDELFFSCGIAAIGTRQSLKQRNQLPDLCRRQSGRRCFTTRQTTRL